MTVLMPLLGFCASLLLSAFSSGAETGLYRTSRIRMRVFRDQGDKNAGLVLKLLKKIDSLVTAILITNNIASYAGTYFLTMQLIRWHLPQAELLATLILSPTFFILGESLPKQLAYNHATELTLKIAPILAALRLVFAPAVWILNTGAAAFRSLLGIRGSVNIASSERAKLMEYFEAGVAENIITADQNSMAKRIMDLESINAADIMIPIAKLLRMPERTSRAKAVAKIASAHAELAMLTDGAGRATGKIVTLSILIRKPGRPEEAVVAQALELGRIKSGASLNTVMLWLKNNHAQRVAVTERGRITGVITAKSILDRISGR